MQRYDFHLVFAVSMLGLLGSYCHAQADPYSEWVHPGADGKLIYRHDAQGNTVPDFSYAGFAGAAEKIPDAPVKITLEPDPRSVDDLARIQAALDKVGRLPVGSDGLRGAVLLRRGTYIVSGSIAINSSGVVLRGEGAAPTETVLRATMARTGEFIRIEGTGDRNERSGASQTITDDLVPAGGKQFHLSSISGLQVGSPVVVQRNTNLDWVKANHMDHLGQRADGGLVVNWTPGPREAYERSITAIDGNQITLDFPLTTAIESRYGGGFVYPYSPAGRVRRAGVENLRAVSVWIPGPGTDPQHGLEYGVNFADPKNKGRKVGQDSLEHSNTFLSINRAEDIWARDFVCVDFMYSGVSVGDQARRVTVQDGDYQVANPSLGNYQTEPHDKAARYAYCLSGEMTLVQRCTTLYARHSFMTQKEVAGPNVFLDCDAVHQDGFSETHQRWSTGVLYDRIGQHVPTSLRIVNRGSMGTGHGWSAAYSVMWNCVGNPIMAESPPTAPNWAIGCSGTRERGPFGPMQPQVYESWGKAVSPSSLFLAQLRDRLGPSAVENLKRSPVPGVSP